MRAIAASLFLLVICVEVSPALAQCTDADADGFYYEAGCGTAQDCNDAAATTYPNAPELCDGYDNDCDGVLDNAPACDGTCDQAEKATGDTNVSNDSDDSEWPVLAWAESVYGVAWSSEAGGQRDIYFARVSDVGTKLSETRVTNSEGFVGRPSVVWTGSEYGVAWRDDRHGNTEIYFARLDALGNTIGDEIRLTDDPGTSVNPSLTWFGAGYGLAWADNRDGNMEVYFVRLDTTGSQLGNVTQVTNAEYSSQTPSLVWNRSEFALAWMDDRAGNTSDIFFARLGPTGDKLADEIVIAGGPEYSGSPDLAWTGSGYGIAWVAQGPPDVIYYASLDTLGNKTAPEVLIANEVAAPALAWTGAEFGVAWVDHRDSHEPEIYFVRIDPDGTKKEPDLRITYNATGSWRPSIVWNGSTHGVGWYDLKPGAGDIFFARVGCNCVDADTDGISSCNDCDDTHSDVYPGAEQVCDSVNNDCDDPAWPSLPPPETDDDGDTFTECSGDCDDGQTTVYPGAVELCDGLNNNCDDPTWPTPPADDRDDDGDTLSECAEDCDDTSGSTYPNAPQLCDGLNNDCNEPNWPIVPPDETDDDGDTYAECEGDCDDEDAAINPNASELCNAIDDNCNALIDDDENGEDVDSDGVNGVCDNCPMDANPSQTDTDGDGRGNSCDNCIQFPNLDQDDTDGDQVGDACDNCALDANVNQEDFESDNVGDACDNCFFTFNPSQGDVDSDLSGDACDTSDGLIYTFFTDSEWVEWDQEEGFDSWNSYRGDLSDLRLTCDSGTCVYTQAPGSNALARRDCDLTNPWVQDAVPPAAGDTAYFLTTGNIVSVESDLGQDSAGTTRPNDNPCP